MAERVYRADPGSRASVKDAIARRLIDAGWHFQRGSSAPWIPPDEEPPRTQLPVRPGRVQAPGDEPRGYSLLGAAARQAELDGATQDFQRHAEEPVR